MNSIARRIAEELGVREQQVNATVELLDEGATVPFIARYRKEITGSLDDSQLRNLEERLRYLRELEDRRATILKSIEEQGKLTDELKRLADPLRYELMKSVKQTFDPENRMNPGVLFE